MRIISAAWCGVVDRGRAGIKGRRIGGRQGWNKAGKERGRETEAATSTGSHARSATGGESAIKKQLHKGYDGLVRTQHRKHSEGHHCLPLRRMLRGSCLNGWRYMEIRRQRDAMRLTNRRPPNPVMADVATPEGRYKEEGGRLIAPEPLRRQHRVLTPQRRHVCIAPQHQERVTDRDTCK